jgi:ribonuclease HI
MNTVTIFTDGSSRGNPGPGGWGSIVLHGAIVTELGGGESHTTNNRMELTAVIEALEFVSKLTSNPSTKLRAGNSSLATTVNTDSSYVLNGATKWLSGWQKNNWKTKAKGEVLNQDLWERLADVLGELPKVSWNLIKGHSGVPANERCDVIATCGWSEARSLQWFSYRILSKFRN